MVLLKYVIDVHAIPGSENPHDVIRALGLRVRCHRQQFPEQIIYFEVDNYDASKIKLPDFISVESSTVEDSHPVSIVSKYGPDDRVWFMEDNRPVCDTVWAVLMEARTDIPTTAPMLKYGTVKGISYQFWDSSNDSILATTWMPSLNPKVRIVPEHKVFSSRAELIASL